MVYSAKQLADAFRTVRTNTIQIAQDIPEDKYSFRPTPDVRSIGEELAHIACGTWFPLQVHSVDKRTSLAFDDFRGYMSRVPAMEQALTTKTQIVETLKTNGDAFASFLESMSDEQLSEMVNFPPPMQPSQKSRFEMLLASKEHEMHHRGKLMLMQRLVGVVPHLTQRRQQMQAAAAAGVGVGGGTKN